MCDKVFVQKKRGKKEKRRGVWSWWYSCDIRIVRVCPCKKSAYFILLVFAELLFFSLLSLKFIKEDISERRFETARIFIVFPNLPLSRSFVRKLYTETIRKDWFKSRSAQVLFFIPTRTCTTSCREKLCHAALRNSISWDLCRYTYVYAVPGQYCYDVRICSFAFNISCAHGSRNTKRWEILKSPLYCIYLDTFLKCGSRICSWDVDKSIGIIYRNCEPQKKLKSWIRISDCLDCNTPFFRYIAPEEKAYLNPE